MRHTQTCHTLRGLSSKEPQHPPQIPCTATYMALPAWGKEGVKRVRSEVYRRKIEETRKIMACQSPPLANRPAKAAFYFFQKPIQSFLICEGSGHLISIAPQKIGSQNLVVLKK